MSAKTEAELALQRKYEALRKKKVTSKTSIHGINGVYSSWE